VAAISSVVRGPPSQAWWRPSVSMTIMSRRARRSAGLSGAASARASVENRAAARSPAAGRASRISSSGALASVTSGTMRPASRTVRVTFQPGGPAPTALAVAGPSGAGAGGASSGE
jgi:hypothetical protein